MFLLSLPPQKDPPSPPTVSSVMEMFEDLRVLAEAAQKFKDMPLDKEKMAFLLSLEEKARQMGIDHTSSFSSEGVQPAFLKPTVKVSHDAMKSLSLDSSGTRFKTAQRLLDDVDDDGMDEIGVSIPDDYRSSEEKMGVTEPEETKVKETGPEGKSPKSGSAKSERKRAKKGDKTRNGSGGQRSTGKGSEKEEKSSSLAMEEYEDHLRKVEERFRHSGKDLSSEDSGLSALLAEFRKNLSEGVRQNLAAVKKDGRHRQSKSKQEENLKASEDKKEKEEESGSSDDAEDSALAEELPGMGRDWYEDDEDVMDYKVAKEQEEEDDEEEGEALEEGVASSWYSISETSARGGAVGGGASGENQVQGKGIDYYVLF